MVQTSVSAQNHAALIWKIADLLRGPYQPNQYGDVILPFTILRRLDAVLAPTKDAVLAEYKKIKSLDIDHQLVLSSTFDQSFFNTSPWNFERLAADPEGLADNLSDYISGFTNNIRDVFDGFEMDTLIAGLARSDRLYLIVKEFAGVDLHPDTVSGHEMGNVFEELIRKFAESNNAAAGDHFTPREVIELMVDLLYADVDLELTGGEVIRSIYDPAAGTGGMLSVAYDHLKAMNPDAVPVLYGQEINARSYAMCKSDMVIKGQDINHIYNGDTLTDDNFPTDTFDFLLSNPPFGVDWRTQQKHVNEEHERLGLKGRFGPGLPRVSDGAMLFLLHLISKMRPVRTATDKGSRLAIVLNGSPLFTGGAGSGESEIRRYILEHDLLDAIIALPTDMFYNTGIATYIWILDNKKLPERRGKVQLIDATGMFGKMRKSLGAKRNYLRPEDIEQIVKLYAFFRHDDGEDEPALSKIFNNSDFGYRTITVERPLQLSFHVHHDHADQVVAARAITRLDADGQQAVRAAVESMTGQSWSDLKVFTRDLKTTLAEVGLEKPTATVVKAIWQTIGQHDPDAVIATKRGGAPEADTSLRDTENVPLSEEIEDYFNREVLPHVPDAWIDHDKTKIGYEIPFTRHFYRYTPPRPLDEIRSDLRTLVEEIQDLLKEVGA